VTRHDHRTVVEGCFRCDLSADEVPDATPSTQQLADSEIWSAECVCSHLFSDHWFDMTKLPPDPDSGCHECDVCGGFKIATSSTGGEKYLHWSEAGGPNECEHGYAEGIDCPRCDVNPKLQRLQADLQAAREEARVLAGTNAKLVQQVSQADLDLEAARQQIAALTSGNPSALATEIAQSNRKFNELWESAQPLQARLDAAMVLLRECFLLVRPGTNLHRRIREVAFDAQQSRSQS
jgi:hypothetical protein